MSRDDSVNRWVVPHGPGLILLIRFLAVVIGVVIGVEVAGPQKWARCLAILAIVVTGWGLSRAVELRLVRRLCDDAGCPACGGRRRSITRAVTCHLRRAGSTEAASRLLVVVPAIGNLLLLGFLGFVIVGLLVHGD
jgi:hypothetical protein